MSVLFYFLVISLVSISLTVLLVGGLTWLLSKIFGSPNRKGIVDRLMISAGIGSTVSVAIYSLSQFSNWTGQGILGLLLIPIPALLGGVLATVFTGIYLEISKR